MEVKFLILLFVTIFFNGVTCLNVSDVNSTDIKPLPTSTVPINNPGSITSPLPPIHQPVPPVTVKPSEEIDSKNKTTDALKIPPASTNSSNTSQAVDPKSAPIVPVTSKTEKSTEASEPAAVPAGESKSNSTKPIVPNANSTVVAPSNSTEPAKPASTSTETPVTQSTPTTKLPATTLAPGTTTANHSNLSGPIVPLSSGQKERQFDGASFIGGIVLTVGLTAIGFIAFKYYKAGKIEINYRTL